jgi:hypothetical protein
MSRIMEIEDLEFDGDRLLVRAVVEDAVLVGQYSPDDPPEWGPALCSGSFLMGDETLIPATDAELKSMLEDGVDDWAPIDWSDCTDD